jgi:hypothetical protein
LVEDINVQPRDLFEAFEMRKSKNNFILVDECLASVKICAANVLSAWRMNKIVSE